MSLHPDPLSFSIPFQTCARPSFTNARLRSSLTEIRLRSSSCLDRCLRFLFSARFHFHRLLFHPLIQFRFLEAPAIAQFECRNLLLVHVFVKRVLTHSQVLGSLANIHYFSRVGHNVFLRVRVYFGVLSISQPEARASPRESHGFTGFYGVLLELRKIGLEYVSIA